MPDSHAPKRLVLFATGGTISMKFDAGQGAALPVLKGGELAAALPAETGRLVAEVRELGLLGGSQIGPLFAFELARLVESALDEEGFDGAVLTQGTDTVEEVAYTLDLQLKTGKPVVLTAAMRSNSDLGFDGTRNLDAALRVAAAESAAGKGVLVVLNDEIHAALDVVKADSIGVQSFTSPGRGPLGYAFRKGVVFHHAPLLRQKIGAARIETRVPLLKFGFGQDGLLARAAVEQGAQGLVLEGAGAPNFPEPAEEDILHAVGQGLPVVLASRCWLGSPDDTYGYPGAGHRLTAKGALLAQGLNSVKARVKLMLALGAGLKDGALRDLFHHLY